MIDILQLAQGTGATGIDWAGLSAFLVALGSIIAAVLQFMGKTAASKRAQEAAESTAAVVRGVEAADHALKDEDFAALAETLKGAGVKLEPEQAEAAARAAAKLYQKHVKKTIKATAQNMDAEAALSAVVQAQTKRLDPEELAKRLKKNGV